MNRFVNVFRVVFKVVGVTLMTTPFVWYGLMGASHSFRFFVLRQSWTFSNMGSAPFIVWTSMLLIAFGGVFALTAHMMKE